MLRRRTLPGGGTGRWLSERLIYSTHLGHNEPPYDANNPIMRGSQPVAETDYLTDALTREAISFIDRHRDKPFFLALTYNAVHSPLQGADRYLDRFKQIEDIHRRIFAAMLANLDASIGAILQKLRDTDLERDTFVIFLSDNGGPTRELTSRNTPLRGEKGDVYEGGLRVPFLFQWPNGLPAGTIYDQPVSSLDLLPTAASSAQIAIPRGLDGVDLIPFLTGRNAGLPHKDLYWRQGIKTAFRAGDWKLVRMRGPPRARTNPMWELYNLADDISETKNLANQFPEKVAELSAAWEKVDAEMIAPRF
jgi:arylsulfatase B